MPKFSALSLASARRSYVPSDKTIALSQLQTLLLTGVAHKLLSVDSIMDTSAPSSKSDVPLNIRASFWL